MTEPKKKSTLADLDIDVLADAMVSALVSRSLRAATDGCSNENCSNGGGGGGGGSLTE
jgi:hypothetical protein